MKLTEESQEITSSQIRPVYDDTKLKVNLAYLTEARSLISFRAFYLSFSLRLPICTCKKNKVLRCAKSDVEPTHSSLVLLRINERVSLFISLTFLSA